MNKRHLLSILLSITTLVSLAQSRMSLNGEWLFRLATGEAEADSLVAEKFYSPDYAAAGFKQTPVPSNWAVLGFEEPTYRNFAGDKASEGLYIRHFHAPASFSGKRLLLSFGGVWASAEVWLNGQRIGRHDSGFTSFSFDVTNVLKGGADNTLAVRVRQVYPGYKTDTYDDWALGGIYRDVSIEAMPSKRFIERVLVRTRLANNYRDADIEVSTLVADRMKKDVPGNYPGTGRPYQLAIMLNDADGKTVYRDTMHVAGHPSATRVNIATIHLADANKWTAETPYLYRLHVALIEKGKVAQTDDEKIGVREISTRGGVLSINGQPVKLRGINRHDEWPDVGRATTREHWLKDLKLMKQANINYIRACHYQHARGFIEMCDSIGMYVGEEISLGGASGLMMDPSFISAVMLRTQETVERDINSPSIIYWSVGNEDAFSYMFLRAVRTVKGIDGSRPCLLPWNASTDLPADIDILAPHYWTVAEYDSICRTAGRPVITTEYTHAYGTGRFGGLSDRWKAIARSKYGAGGAVWMWADQGLRTPTLRDEHLYGHIDKTDKHLRISSAGWDGIVDSYRNPTSDYYELKAVYCPVYPEADTIAIRNGQKKVGVAIRNGYDFTPLSSTTISWRLMVDEKQTDKGTIVAEAAPHASAIVSIPLNKLPKLTDGMTPYIIFSFTNGQGEEIGRRAVELVVADLPKRATGAAPTASETSQSIILSSGKASCEISRATGLPSVIKLKGQVIAKGMRPTVWHKLGDGEQTVKNCKFASGINLEHVVPHVVSISRDANTVKAEVEYSWNDSNSVKATYVCTMHSDGKLSISYDITPDVQTNYVPIVGLAMQMPSPSACSKWMGRGPGEVYPNKREGEVLGVWDATRLEGTHDAKWVEIGRGRFWVNGYIDRDSAGSTTLRLLSHVLGRPEKGRLNDRQYQLPTHNTYHGLIEVDFK